MQFQTVSYLKDKGWDQDLPKELDSEQTLLILFGAPEFIDDSEAIVELRQSFPKASIVGCSSAGEIFDTEVRDHSISVAIVCFEHTTHKVVSEKINSAGDSSQVGSALAKQLNQQDLRAVMIFSDGLNVNGSSLVDGFNSILPEGVVVTGGLAGDGPNFTKTWVINQDKPTTQFITAVGLYGDKIQVSHGSQGGWDIFGPERLVTKSEGNIVYEIDGRPALELYKEYLGEKSSELPASGLLFPLQVRATKEDEKRLVRTILGVDEDKQSLIFAGDIQQGSLAQLMRANFDRLIDGAEQAGTDVDEKSAPVLSIAISCVGRRLVLGERTEEEVEATLHQMPKGSKQVGFYSYGEISPHVKGDACELHNQTMTLTTIKEAA